MLRSLSACLVIGAFIAAPCTAASPAPGSPAPAAALSPAPATPHIPTAPQVDARSYILVDYRTDKTLAAKDAEARMEPASLTKLMTAYIVFQELAAGKLKLDQPVTVSEHAWRSEGSRTFIELGKPVSVQDLILGMIVQSGNDATIALAERIAGTEETFAQLMNAEAARLGMTGTHFENSSGLPSPQHYTTARDMSLLAIAMIRDFPQYYKYYSIREFEHNGIKQQNRNGLLEKDPTVDGLKTGHTDSAGFCLVTSALRDGMRLVSVVLGSTSMKARENASAALLNYGFTFYDTRLLVKAGHGACQRARLEGGSLAGGSRADGRFVPDAAARRSGRQNRGGCSAAADSAARSRTRMSATLRVLAGGQTLATLPLHPLTAVAPGGWWRRLIDTIHLWFV